MSDKEESPSGKENGAPDKDREGSRESADDEKRSGSARSSRSGSSRRKSYSRSRSRSHRRRHHYYRSHSPSPRYRDDYSRSRSRSYSPRHRSSYYYKKDYYRSRSRSPMSRRRRHVGNREEPPPSRCIGVFGLSLYTQEKDLREVFSKYGPVEEVTIVYDAQSGRSRGFAFVYFEEVEDAKVAKERCNGLEIDGRKIRVDYSITQRPHTPTPGIYMGKPTYPRYGRGRGGYYRDHSPSPYYSRSRRYSRSRSRSYSPRKYDGY